MADDLLIEIGTEELPPKSLNTLAGAFAKGIEKGFDDAQLGYQRIVTYATPRRLAILARGLASKQPAREQLRRGPSLKAAFDEEGEPTPAALGFAGSCGVSVDQLERLETDKGSWLAHRSDEQGASTETLAPRIIDQALAGLPIPKRMRWGDGDVEFVRPVHWVVLLYGSEVIDAEVLGLRSGRHTRGHRFHRPEPIELGQAADYAATLQEKGKVLPVFAERRGLIESQVKTCAQQCGGSAVIDSELLDEVTALVEWPVAFSGHLDERYLELPAEVLVATLKDHQKCFHVIDNDGRLLPYFVAVSNIESRSPEIVRHGNERVVEPRLSDAAFFWDQDRKTPLADRIDGLRGVVFQERLGTVYDKAQRLSDLAEHVADEIGADPELARRAGQLCKCDLLTDMVGEFPELQGVMGRYYALDSGEPSEVAKALKEHYLPRYAGDRLPSTGTGKALAIADKIDTLVGIFAIGKPPSGDKDPFALRRLALAVLRIIIEEKLELDLEQILARSARTYPDAVKAESTLASVFEFMMERLRRYYLDDAVTPDIFEAVLARRPTQPFDFDQRIRAVKAFNRLPEAQSLAAANKRVGNILKQAATASQESVDQELLREPEERTLAEQLSEISQTIAPRLQDGAYTEALTELAGLRDSVDQFFDSVMVMCDDQRLRNNRLALLNQMSNLFLQVADISLLRNQG